MPHASRKHEHAVGWPNTIDLLNKQAVRGYLHQVRMMNTLGMWFLLDGDEVTPRAQKVIGPAHLAEPV